MSSERRLRRAEREREAAVRAAARAAERERRERRAARVYAVRSAATSRLRPVGRDTGSLARRRRRETLGLALALLLANAVVWFTFGDWALRAGALVVSVLTFPVLKTLLFPR